MNDTDKIKDALVEDKKVQSVDKNTYRKWLLTINNPDTYGFTLDAIKRILSSLNLKYWCLAYEQGSQLHVHIFLYFENNARFARIKKLFHAANIIHCDAKPYEIRNYVLKGGKWQGSEKEETRIHGTFEEYGEIPYPPENSTSKETVTQKIISLVDEGRTVEEIIRIVPSAALKINQLSQLREEFIRNKNKDKYRLNLETYYLYGPPGIGKTRYVYDHFKASEICRITDYGNKTNKTKFDNYHGEKVLCLDEYNGQIPITELNTYLDIYPNLLLPARYFDRLALYEKVFIISNKPLTEQYKDIQKEYPELFKALERRINYIYEFVKSNEFKIIKKEGEKTHDKK